MPKSAISLAIVGCGFVAQQTHLPCFASNDKFIIKCLADPYQDLAKSLAVKYEVPKIVASHREICDMDDIDAVVVTLPRPLTAAVVLDLASAGKHILAEKPISLNSNSKHQLMAACEMANGSVMTGYMRQHDNGTKAFKQLIQQIEDCSMLSIFSYCHMGDSYASPFGDKKGSDLVSIQYEEQRFPSWLNEDKYYAFEQFINVFSHLTHALEFIFNAELSMVAANVNQMAEGQILCRLGSAFSTLELIRGSQIAWREGICATYRDQQIRLEYAPAFLRNHPAMVTHLSNEDGIRQLPYNWSWAFRNQSNAFYDFIHSDIDYKRNDLLRAFRQVEFAEALFKTL